MVIENLFPLPIGFFKYEGALDKEFLHKQDKLPNEGNSRSADAYVLKHVELLDLRQFIDRSLHDYFMATCSPKNDAGLRITQSWLNWTKPGEYHHKHFHLNSFISGVFYIDANKDMDRIYFFNPNNQTLTFPAIEYNAYNSESWWFPVESGDLILFPSSLTHMVRTVDGENTRTSLAFNTFPFGEIGDEINLTSLKIGR